MSGFVTTTETTPFAWAGAVAMIDVLLENATPVAGVPPIVTVGTAEKPVPVIVTLTPPAVVAVFGETLVTVGAGAAYVKPFANVTVRPSGLVTTTAT